LKQPLHQHAEGAATFLRSSLAAPAELSTGSVAVLGVPHDSTLGSRQGSRYGPRGIRDGSLQVIDGLRTASPSGLGDPDGPDRIQLRPSIDVVDVGDVPVFPNDLARSVDSMAAGARQLAVTGARSVLLGGDHFVSYPLFKGWSAGMHDRGLRKFGYIQFDNHLDLMDDNKLWGKLWHGSQARRIAELPGVSPANMVWIGASGPQGGEQVGWLRTSGASWFTPTDIAALGIVEVTTRAIAKAADGVDAVYVSLDIDVLDGGISPGTGSVVVGGMLPADLFTAMRMLAQVDVVRALDIAEVAPPLDPTDRTVRIAATAALQFAGAAALVGVGAEPQ
jgi:agmatinase